MKIITLNENEDLVVDNVAYLSKFDEPVSYIAVDTNGVTHQLTESQYEDAKNYLNE